MGALASTPAAAPTADDKERAKLVKAAQAFEAVFVRQMIGSMRQAKLGDDLFGSDASDQFREMQDAQFADQMVHDGGFGVAAMLIKQFDRQGGGQ
ncbi:MAG: rod-binding protein [Sphingomonadaceae bacterium]|nr:rod-binding protein [Sphingomonadaceae bacterium]